MCFMCAETNWCAASAAIKLSSPARTADATKRASCAALCPGSKPPDEAPATPSIARHAAGGEREEKGE